MGRGFFFGTKALLIQRCLFRFSLLFIAHNPALLRDRSSFMCCNSVSPFRYLPSIVYTLAPLRSLLLCHNFLFISFVVHALALLQGRSSLMCRYLVFHLRLICSLVHTPSLSRGLSLLMSRSFVFLL